MTQPYGQQPGGTPGGGGFQQPGGTPGGGFQQPGGPNPGSGGFQQPGTGGYPQAPQAPAYQQGYGGMPQAPQEYSGGPIARPGGTTAAAVLAFVQAGLTLITTAILMIALAAVTSIANKAEEANAGGVDITGSLAEAWIVSIVQLVGAGLLIYGGVKLMSGASGPLFLIATGLQVALCIYWLIRGATPFVPVLLAVMPIVAASLTFTGTHKQFVASRSGRPA